MADKLEIHWSKAQLNREIGKSEEVYAGISQNTARFGAAANAMGADFRTAKFYDRSEGKTKGGTVARYDFNVERNGSDRWPIGLVWPANYAAWKDIMKNNTLLKVVS